MYQLLKLPDLKRGKLAGNFTRDSGRTFDGDTGMNIFTQGKPNIITLSKPLI